MFNNNLGKQSYTATLGQTDFDFNFRIYQLSDLKIYKTLKDETPDDDKDLVNPSEYSVTNITELGGKVVFTSAVELDATIVILRELPVTRETDYRDGGDLPAETLDNDQDYQTYLIMDLFVKLRSSITIPDSIPGVDVDAGLPAPAPDGYLKWDATAKKLENDVTLKADIDEVKKIADDIKDLDVTKLRTDVDINTADIRTNSEDISTLFGKVGLRMFNLTPLVGTTNKTTEDMYPKDMFSVGNIDGTMTIYYVHTAIPIGSTLAQATARGIPQKTLFTKNLEDDVFVIEGDISSLNSRVGDLESASTSAVVPFIHMKRNTADNGYEGKVPKGFGVTYFGFIFDDEGKTDRYTYKNDNWKWKSKATLEDSTVSILDTDFNKFLNGNMTIVSVVKGSTPSTLLAQATLVSGRLLLKDTYDFKTVTPSGTDNKDKVIDITMDLDRVLAYSGVPLSAITSLSTAFFVVDLTTRGSKRITAYLEPYSWTTPKGVWRIDPKTTEDYINMDIDLTAKALTLNHNAADGWDNITTITQAIMLGGVYLNIGDRK